MELQTAKDLQNDINNNIDVLIQKIQPLTKQNQTNVNITQLLTEFYKTVQKSENYHKIGIFALNFAKAASFLDHAFNIYAKQVDLLWDLSINAQKRYLSYEEDSAEKVEAEKRLEEKVQRGKRGRKKNAIVEAPPEKVDWKKVRIKMKKYLRKSLLDLEEFNFEDELDGVEINPEGMKAFESLKWIKTWNKLYPKKYVMAPYLDSGFVRQIDEDCFYHSDNATNYLDFMFPEIQRKFTYNNTDNKKLDVIGCDVHERAFQQFLCNEQITNPNENFTVEVCQKFKKFLDKYLIEGQSAINLSEKCKKLCPRRTSIVLTRLSSDVVQKHLTNDEIPSTSKDDSGFFEDFDDTTSPPSPIIETPKENIIRRSQRKRKPIITEDEEPVLKRKRKKDVFKWLKTTTVSLKNFEKFFSANYIAAYDEGKVQVIDFSSDDDDVDDNFPCNTQENDEESQNEINKTMNPNIEQSKSDNFEKRENEAALKRYLEWNRFIKDELKKRDQKEFDIHEYGTKIIDRLSDEKSVGFNEVLINSNINSGGGEIPRYFAAALQLVNSKNVEFTNFTSGQLSNNLELILINRDRHHEHLDQYKNASDAIIQENVKKIGGKRRYDNDDVKEYKKLK